LLSILTIFGSVPYHRDTQFSGNVSVN